MTGFLPVRIAASAARAIEEAGAWWRSHRDKAPRAFVEDIERALTLISMDPRIGARARNPRLDGVRRVRLSRIRYHLYYRVVAADEPTVEVLALWHERRGDDPPISDQQAGHAVE